VKFAGGKSPADIIGRSLYDLLVGQDLGVISERLRSLEKGGPPLSPLETEGRILDGSVVDCEIVSGSVMFSGEPAIQSIVRDITERKRMQEELIRLATTDSLTGILNRRKFFEEMEKEWSRARRHSRSLSLIMCDLDEFKSINDLHGHAVGDRVLQGLVTKTNELLRSEDLFARLGGEEFCILLPEVKLEGAGILAERIRAALEDLEIESPSCTISCTVSFGVVACQLALESIDRALQRADDALYEAKRRGRNRVEIA